MLFSWKKLAEQRGGRMGDIIDCLNGFHHTSAKSMTFFFFLLRRILYPLHICLLHNILYPHNIDLPASVLQTSAYDIYYKMLLFYHPTHCLRKLLCLVLQCPCSETVIFWCSIPSFVCVFINKTTAELHAQYYMSLSKPGVTSVLAISGPEVMWSCTVWGQGCAFHMNIYLIYIRLIKCCTISIVVLHQANFLVHTTLVSYITEPSGLLLSSMNSDIS